MNKLIKEEEPALTARIAAKLFKERFGKKPDEVVVIKRKLPIPFTAGAGANSIVQASDGKGKTLTMPVPQ